MKTKNGMELSIEEVNAQNYIVPKGEERYFHVKLEVKQYNPKTGVKISVPAIQKFGPKTYKLLIAKQLKRMGYEIEVLHNPDEWMRENAAKIAEIKAARAKAAQEAAEAKKAAEKAALKAEILAELKAAGVIADGETKKAGRPKKEQAEES